MKHRVLLGCLGVLLLQNTYANNFFDKNQWSMSGNMTLASDYHWRGISMTNGDPAIQGGLQLKHQKGIYAGVWASSSDIDNGSSIEADFMFGYRHAVNQNNALILQYIDINYPGHTDSIKTNFEEYSVSLDNSSLFRQNDLLKTSIAFSPEYYNHSGHMWRFDSKYSFPVNQDFGLIAAIGATKLEDHNAFFKVWGSDKKNHYYDWKFGLSSSLFNLYSELYYADNSTINPNVSSMNPRVVFSVTKVF
nr:TorF family putative porin [Acinetobacter sp. Marseille-Q1620]